MNILWVGVKNMKHSVGHIGSAVLRRHSLHYGFVKQEYFLKTASSHS